MAKEVNEVLRSLHEKFEQLVSRYEKVKDERDLLVGDLANLKAKDAALAAQLKEVEQKYKTLQMAQALSVANGGTEVAKEQIGKIVREIDKCITLLTK
jgi:septation ring formation regulator EzrA